MNAAELERQVAGVVDDVRRRGDAALLEFTERWDGVRLTAASLRVPGETLAAAPEDSAFASAFRNAAARIRSFHDRVRPRTVMVEDGDGVSMGLRWTPIRAVGLYVPGGKASYPSTLAMTAIPAQIAGVERIAVVSPPGPDGEVSPQILLAARILGLREVYRVGGAQAIAALALGTETIPRVDKIFGPGNAYVAEAKKQLFGAVGIDVVAGPSEIVVYADETAEPEWVAADLLAQAEHDESTRVTLLASSATVLKRVRQCLERRLANEPRREIIRSALDANGVFEVAGDAHSAAARINDIAPEHLSLQVSEPQAILAQVRNAGAIFLGKETPVAIGDYYAGPNHVLPTGAAARYASALSVEDFMKRSNVVRTSIEFVRRATADVDELARGEGLPAHASSVHLRRKSAGAQARRGLRSVTPYTIVEEEGDVKLNQNESPWDVPAEVKDEVARRLRELPWNRYHQKVPEVLLAEIAADAGFPAASVIAGSGSNLVLQWIFEAYGGPGNTVLMPTPSFSLYPLWAEVTEMRAVEVPLGADFEYDADAFVDRVREIEPALTVLCLPNNPTGGELESGAVARIAEAAAEGGGLLVIDEAYREFGAPHHDRSSLAREADNVVLVRTFSKAFSAAGMRLGYALAPPAVAAELRKIVPPFHLSLFAAVLGTVLREKKEYFGSRVAEVIAERDRMMETVSGLPGVKVFPSQANFFLLEVTGAAEVVAGLKSRGVLVRRFDDEALAGCLRVNAGTPQENDRFLEALREELTAR